MLVSVAEYERLNTAEKSGQNSRSWRSAESGTAVSCPSATTIGQSRQQKGRPGSGGETGGLGEVLAAGIAEHDRLGGGKFLGDLSEPTQIAVAKRTGLHLRQPLTP